ncbi:MAG: DUF1614 domain-containing protein [Eubacteriales bacterium]
MTRFSIGLVILVVISILIYFGLAHRALDRMRLSDRGALGVIVAVIIGSFIDIPIPGGRYLVSVNAGGALVPVALVIYLLIKAGTARERIRAIAASIVTALAIFVVGSLIMRGLPEPGGRFEFIDSLYIYPLVGGTVAYLGGRSRRAAFIAATLGVLYMDIGYYFWLAGRGAPAGRVSIGGAGAFDAIILAGIVAILIAEVIGESRERLQGGPVVEGRPPSLLKGLRKPEMDEDKKINAETEEAGGGAGGKDKK